MPELKRAAARLSYYFANIARDLAPQAYFRRQLPALLAQAGDDGDLRARVNYYNQLDQPFEVTANARCIGQIPMNRSRYYYDLKEHARYFDRSLRMDILFGDVKHVPPVPTIVKSRPIGEHNRNSVLLKLNKFRHYRLTADPYRFEAKRPKVVWRGVMSEKRRLMVEACAGLPLCDVGFTSAKAPAAHRHPFMTIPDQMAYRYIMSVEGNDVATNLKWIMASNSVCVMTVPTMETWFMEGRLKGGVHYIEVKPDYSDLSEKIEYYEKHAQEAQSIVANAHAYLKQFFDRRAERLISLLVLQKYFALSGQI